MADRDTLMAYLIPKLTNRVEDAATDALAFILNRSAGCLGALDRLLRDEDFYMEPIAAVRTQVTYKDGSRPDMVGYDRNGAKRLLVEAKFWAGLLKGQAVGYFRLLEEDGPGVLLFIAPDSRIDTLWAEIRRRMESGEDGSHLEIIETDDRTRKAGVVGSDKRLMLVSWTFLLDYLAVAAVGDGRVASDIEQLRGLARWEDAVAFRPIHPDEFGLSLPRRIRGLNRLIDDVVSARGVPQGWMTVKGLRATPQREGYGRYLRLTDVPVDLFLGVNVERWATSGDTPLWLWISRRFPMDAGRMKERAPSLIKWGNDYWLPIHLKTGLEYEAVLDDAVRQVRAVWGIIDRDRVSASAIRAGDAPPDGASPTSGAGDDPGSQDE